MGDHVKTWVETAGDAAVRAFRTFYASVGIDILVAIGTGLLLLLDGGDLLSPVFWTGVLVLFLRSTITAVATYWMRLKFPPAT